MPVHAEVNSLNDAELKDKLEKHNVPVGPIVASTRAFYKKKLLSLLNDANEIDETLQDSVGGYEASMESSYHEEFLKQETENSAHARHQPCSWEGTPNARDSLRKPVKNKRSKGSNKADANQIYLIVTLIVAVCFLYVYLYLSWNTGSSYDAVEQQQ